MSSRIARRARCLHLVGLTLWLALLTACGPSSPEGLAEEVRAALSEGSPLEKARRLVPALERLSPQNVDAVRAVFDANVANLHELEISLFVDAWARFDPPAVLEAVKQWNFAIKRTTALEALVYSWALRDPAAAQVVAQELARGVRGGGEFAALFMSGWVFSGVGGIDEYLLAINPDGRESSLATAIGSTIRSRGVEAMLAWADGFIPKAEPFYRPKLFRKVVRAAARRRPELASAWLLEHVDEDYAVHGTTGLGEGWVDLSAEDALQWIGTRAPEEARPEAIAEVLGRWNPRDRDAARAWMESRERDPMYDPALQTFTRQMARRTPEEGLEWCERSSGEEARIACISGVARVWARADPAAAEAWLGQSPLDEAERQRVRRASRLGLRQR